MEKDFWKPILPIHSIYREKSKKCQYSIIYITFFSYYAAEFVSIKNPLIFLLTGSNKFDIYWTVVSVVHLGTRLSFV